MGKNKQTKSEFVLPPASLEQQAVIDALIKDQTNVICQAVAGAGKTTLILNLAQQLVAINPDVKILNLTFNRRLSDSNLRKIKALKLQKSLVSKTFHAFENFPIKDDQNNGFNFKAFKKLIEDWATANQNINLISVASAKKTYDRQNNKSLVWKDYLKTVLDVINRDQSLVSYLAKNTQQWDYICVDEAQDLYEELWWLVLLLNKIWPQAKFLILGDPKQTINQFKGADVRFMEYAPQLLAKEFVHLKLSHSFRITKPIANFINQVAKWDDWMIQADPQKTNNEPVHLHLLAPAIIERKPKLDDYKLDDYESTLNHSMFEKLWALIIDLIEKQGYLPSDITFLSSFKIGETENSDDQGEATRAGMKILVDQFKKFIVNKNYRLINPLKQKDAILNVCEQKKKNNVKNAKWYELSFYSFNAFKGCENKVIIVLGSTFDELEFWTQNKTNGYRNNTSLQNHFYVGYTRALAQLHIVVFDTFDQEQRTILRYQQKPLLARWFDQKLIENQDPDFKIDQTHLDDWLKNQSRLEKIRIFANQNDSYQVDDVFNLEIRPSQICFNSYQDLKTIKTKTINVNNYQPIKAIDYIDGRLAKYQKDPIYVRDLMSSLILTLIQTQINQGQLTIAQVNRCIQELSKLNIKDYNNAKSANDYRELAQFGQDQNNWIQAMHLLKQIPQFDLKQMKIEAKFSLLESISRFEKTDQYHYQVGPMLKWIDHPIISKKAPCLIKLLKSIKTTYGLNNSQQQIKLKLLGFCDAVSNQNLIEVKFNHLEKIQAFSQLVLYNYFLTIENELVDLVNDSQIDDNFLDAIYDLAIINQNKIKAFKGLYFVAFDQGVIEQITNNQEQLLQLGHNLITNYFSIDYLLNDQQFINKYQQYNQ